MPLRVSAQRWALLVVGTILGSLATAGCSYVPSQLSPTTTNLITQSWGPKWCKATPGMAKADLLKLMGKPTVNMHDSVQWDAPGWSLVANYDTNGIVQQLVVGASPFGVTMMCATTRSNSPGDPATNG